MPLIKCPVCKRDVSDAAVSCPHCDPPLSPMQNFLAAAAAAQGINSAGSVGQKRGWRYLLVVRIIGLLIIAVYLFVPEDTPSIPCRTNWRLCSDNSEMAIQFSGWNRAQRQCEHESTKQAGYG